MQKENSPNLPKHRGITLEDIVYCIIVKQLSVKETAKMLECSTSNVKQWLKRHNIKPNYLKQFKEARADLLGYHQSKILNGLTDEKIKKARITEITTAFGTLYDKERTERGLVNEITGHVDLVKEEQAAEARLRKFEERLQITAVSSDDTGT
jgi:transposase